ncbi:MAG: hypothetical protein KDB95_07930 [Flavobacteriales bacterium]|nr:hypothetical protein [Flavobacteriales bacterium]
MARQQLLHLLLVIAAFSWAPASALAQGTVTIHRFSLVADQPISILQEKRLTEWIVGMDPEAIILVDEGRRDLVAQSRHSFDLPALIQAGEANGLTLHRNPRMNVMTRAAESTEE